MKFEEYKALPHNWKPTSFNFKGNPENKAIVQALVADGGFKNEGQALDYIFACYKEIKSKAVQLAEAITPATREEYEKAHLGLVTEIESLKLQLANLPTESQIVVEREDYENLQSHAKKLEGLAEDNFDKAKLFIEREVGVPIDEVIARAKRADALLANPLYVEFKAATEKALPLLLKLEGVELIPISDNDMLNMIVDYAHRDPSKEFPMQQYAEQAYLNFKKLKDESTGPIQNQQAAGAESDKSTSNTNSVEGDGATGSAGSTGSANEEHRSPGA